MRAIDRVAYKRVEPFLTIVAQPRRGPGATIRVKITDPATTGQLMSAWEKIEKLAHEVNSGQRLLGGFMMDDQLLDGEFPVVL